jgi:hypothetical protein
MLELFIANDLAKGNYADRFETPPKPEREARAEPARRRLRPAAWRRVAARSPRPATGRPC